MEAMRGKGFYMVPPLRSPLTMDLALAAEVLRLAEE